MFGRVVLLVVGGGKGLGRWNVFVGCFLFILVKFVGFWSVFAVIGVFGRVGLGWALVFRVGYRGRSGLCSRSCCSGLVWVASSSF